MARYARIKNDVFDGLKEFSSQPPDIAHKNIKWLPCPAVSTPSFDPKTEKLEGPTYAVNASDVTEEWTVTALSGPEIAANKAAATAAINGTYRFIIKALHDLDTRARAEENPPKAARTLAEFETYISGL